MQRKLTFLVCFLVSAAIGIGNIAGFAQSTKAGVFAESGGQYPFVYYTPKDGLINSRVRSIKQDSKGRMIFVTYGGLSMYDGTRFINYNRQNGLADDLVNDIVEVGPDSFLVAANAPKLNTLVKGRIGHYKTADNFYPVTNHFLKSNNGNWYVTADDGLFLLKNDRFTRLPLLDKNGVDVGLYLDKVFEWKNYFLMIPWSDHLREKLIVYDKVNKKVTDIDLKTRVINLARDANGRIWITTSEGPRLIDTLALEKGKINFLSPTEKIKNITHGQRSFIFFDDQNNAWFYNKNIVKISPEFKIQHITEEQGLGAVSLTDLFIDREGTAWLGTDGNGIIKIINTNTELLNSLDQKQISITAVATQNDTVWLFNSANNTVYRFSDNKFRSFALLKKNMIIANFFVNGQKLYLNNGEKLLCVSNKNEEYSYRQIKEISTVNAPNGVGAGMIDKNGVIIQYIRESDTSVFLYALKNDKLLMKQQVSYFVDQMAFDRKGTLWMATRDNHILQFSLHPEDPSHYLQVEKNYSKGLSDLNPRAITIDTSNNIWIGTRLNGVYKFELKNRNIKQVAQFTTRNGLTDNFIYTLTCDSNNTIWAGTQTGLDRIFKKNGNYTIGNVSKNNNFFQAVNKIIVTKNNTVWALTNGGIVLRISTPSSSAKSSLLPAFLFTSVLANNEPHTDSTKDFTFRQNNLSFTVAATSYIDERSIKYSYLLEGSGNTSWSEPSNTSTFNFINLAPGDYALKVKANFPEEMYSSQMITYAFTILPPWWQTWWFKIGAGVLAIGILILGIQSYYRRKLEREKIILERKQAIEKERTRIATDMHDDLGAGLSRIKFLSETIGIKKQKHQPIEEDITKIREYSHEMIDKMGEIVWALNEKNDSFSDLLSYTRSYTVEYLSQNGIHCTVNMPESLPTDFVSGEFRRNIFLTVKEALHNIVKHSQADDVCINISFKKSLLITIKDNGIGFEEKNTRGFGNGLYNMKKRMKDIGGALEFTNQSGTMMILTVPLSL
jgi:signal transduction histidine kinase/ligand-binding sensor domain-containing protein